MARKGYEEQFKKQIVSLYNNGKSLADLNRDYGVAKSTISTWVKRYNNSMSFDINDNRTEEEIELIALIKRVKEILLKGYIGAEMIGNNIKKK